MYKVFVNDKPLFLTDKIEKETDFQLFLLNSVDIDKIIIKYFQNKIDKAFLYHPDKKEILKKIKAKIPVQKAAGGVVFNDLGEVLFIKRGGKWDLPKGGMEKNETTQQTALREVEEETGVGELKIIDKLSKTYHVFKRNGKYRLKITSWYKMSSTFKGDLVGQMEEGIEDVCWMPVDQISKAMDNTYENIRLLIDELALLESN